MNTQVANSALMVAATILVASCSERSGPSDWSSSESIVVEPGVGIGSVHSGMTIQQVIAELGQPDRTLEMAAPEINGAMEYTNYGLCVIPGKAEVVHSVSVNAPFAGRTREGIGMGASRADVIKAYGEPTAAKPISPDFEVLRYDLLGVRFQLEGDKVDLIVITFEDTK